MKEEITTGLIKIKTVFTEEEITTDLINHAETAVSARFRTADSYIQAKKVTYQETDAGLMKNAEGGSADSAIAETETTKMQKKFNEEIIGNTEEKEITKGGIFLREEDRKTEITEQKKEKTDN